ncbi:MAG: squalene--hopene cyclase [Planctomycetes bacterium]|nr:squalene--hopene cyclase [Planctomycetota bacterium]
MTVVSPSSNILPNITIQRLDRAIEGIQNYLLRTLVPTDGEDRRLSPEHFSKEGLGYWIGELEADSTLESDYILFLYFLNPEKNRGKIRKLANYIKSKQLPDGSWNIYYGGPGEISASVKAYFALKLAGRPMTDPIMVKAREAILSMGGAGKVNTFTKIYLSFLNQFDWAECPAIPPEIILLPRFFYFNIYEISYWSRAMLVPLSILYARKPMREIPPEAHIDEIFIGERPRRRTNGNGNGNGAGKNGKNGNGACHSPAGENSQSQQDRGPAESENSEGGGNGKKVRLPAIPRDSNLFSWKNFFLLIDRLLKLIEKAPIKPLRNMALNSAKQWMVSRFEDSDGLGAIFPAMVNSIIAMWSLGYDENHPLIVTNLKKLQELEIEEGGAIRLQPCLSPIWDTALAVNALGEAGLSEDHPAMVSAARWLVSKEVRRSGDCQVRNPDLEASGWYFQFRNDFYPDVDDTAAVLMALERADLRGVEGGVMAIQRGVAWVLRMQCSNGGWAAFDVDVDREIFTKFPFADHNAMLDPACADITGRVLEMLGRFAAHTPFKEDPQVRSAIAQAVRYLKRSQEPSGAWYGRWGVNYLYGTWQVLKGLAAVGVNLNSPLVRKAVLWLKSVQNPDGGWGESCYSYDEPHFMGRGVSTASQTSWAVMGLIAAGEVESQEARRGIQYLLDHQNAGGTWSENEFTGTGFPRVFYLKYHLYSQYFPLFALAYYRNARQGVSSIKPRKPLQLPPPPARRSANRTWLPRFLRRASTGFGGSGDQNGSRPGFENGQNGSGDGPAGEIAAAGPRKTEASRS